jgi:hypothetical protein
MNQRFSPPVVRTRSAGRVSETLEKFAELYKKTNPGMDCRYVFDPQNKPELSGKMARLAMGYRPVFFKDLGDGAELQLLGFAGSADQEVRVADTVLMGIAASDKREMEQENVDRAMEQTRSIDRNYHSAMDAVNEKLSEQHRSRPIGRSVIEEREFEFDYEQREE